MTTKMSNAKALGFAMIFGPVGMALAIPLVNEFQVHGWAGLARIALVLAVGAAIVTYTVVAFWLVTRPE